MDTNEKKLNCKITTFLTDNGCSATWIVAENLKIPTPKVLKIMKTLEKNKKIKRHTHTSKNNIVWEINKEEK